MGLHVDWKDYEDYTRGIQNPVVKEDDPGSVTNIIFPIIVSQVADLVDEPLEITVTGEEPSDQKFADDVRHVLEWIQFRNKMVMKLDRAEWRRLKFGTMVWKVYYDPLIGPNGFVSFEPLSPVTVFPDPKVKETWQLDEGDFFQHVCWKPINYLIRVYGDPAKSIKPQKTASRNPAIFDDEEEELQSDLLSNRALTIEDWYRDGSKLYRRVVANEIKIYDSKNDPRFKGESFYENGRIPFVVVPCYPVEGRIWGMGDAELLIPTQDIINDLDDQIRMNAKLMGNLQMVVGLATGINLKKWTNKPGLKIPAKDPTAWQPVTPPNMPAYILNRRSQGFQEGEIISGRPDVVEGRKSSGVRAASAILALQEAGNRRARHKKLFLQEGLNQVFDLCVDYLKQFFTGEQAFRLLGRDPTQSGYIWFKGSTLRSIPQLIPDGQGGLKQLLDKSNAPQTKDARFDIRISVGAGLPHNKAFLYQTLIELTNQQLITKEEARIFLKDMLDWPVVNPLSPIGDNFKGLFPQQPMNPATMGAMNPNAGMDPNQIDPMLLEKIAAALGGADARMGMPLQGGYPGGPT